MAQKNVKNMMSGAVVGTLIGSVGALLYPERKKLAAAFKSQKKDWLSQAKDISHNLLEEVKHFREGKNEEAAHFLKGALLGLALGAGSALLLAPKSGKQLRHNLKKNYQDVSKKTQDLLESINAEYIEAPKKKASAIVRKVKRKVNTVRAKAKRRV